MDWVPISAAALVSGATALFFAAQLVPRPDGDGALLRAAESHGNSWAALAVLLTIAAVGLIIGIPALFTLFQRTGFRTGLTAAVCLAIGAVMLAAFAQVLIVFRNLARTTDISDAAISAMAEDNLQQGMLVGGFLVFYLGEALLATALFRARSTPAWVPWLFLAHLATVPLSMWVLPGGLRGVGVILMTAGFAGVAISANRLGRG